MRVPQFGAAIVLARDLSASVRSRSVRTVAAFGCTVLCGLSACEGPTLWIGDAIPDAGTTVVIPPDVPVIGPEAEAHDASVPPARPSASPPSTVTEGQGVATRETSPPPPSDPEDAGVPPRDPDPADVPSTTLPVLRPTNLPRAEWPCPAITAAHGTYRFGNPSGRNLNVEVYVARDAKAKPAPGGPLILYWHAVGDTSTEVVSGFGQAAIDEVVAQGGMVASFNTKLCVTCGLADDAVWYDQDDPVTDHVVACAIEQANIDTRRIHSLGFSAGALRSMHLALARSNYIASVVSYSGGMLDDTVAADPTNKVPSILTYGRQGADTIVLNFTDLSLTWYETNRPLGYYTMLCQHEGPHIIPEALVPHAIRFFRDHPYRVSPEPYAQAIPNGYPAFCSNTPRR